MEEARPYTIEELSEAYWFTDMRTRDIAALGGYRNSYAFIQDLLPITARVRCWECERESSRAYGSRAQIGNLNHLELIRTGTFSSRDVCDACLRRRNQAYREERERKDARAAELRSMPYRDYLATPEWLERRAQHLRSARYRCQLCNRQGLLNVHHRTYANRGCEAWGDLIVLCRECHTKFHHNHTIAG